MLKSSAVKIILAAILLFLLAGCALEPGMHFKEQTSPAKFFWSEVTQEDLDKLKIITIDESFFQVTDVKKDQINSYFCTSRAEDYIYLVGPRDILSIIVWEHPELTIPAGAFRSPSEAGTLVSPDGTIFYPYVGTVHVAGKSLREISELVVTRLSRYIENPQVDVRIAAYRSKKAHTTGEVKEPAILPITDVPITILDAINLSGWLTPEADKSTLILTRNGKNYPLDLTDIMEEGSVLGKCLVQDGDTLYFPDNIHNKVFVMGEVVKQSVLFMHKSRMTLVDALGDAGGVNPITSEPSKIYVIRKGAKPQIYLLNADSPDALLLADRFDLQPRDIVFVSTSRITRWNRIISQLVPSVDLLDKTVNFE